MTRYIGFSEFYHDAGIAVIEEDGRVSYATHAERWSKKKNDAYIPHNLWDYVGYQDDEVVTFYEDHNIKYGLRGGINVDVDPKDFPRLHNKKRFWEKVPAHEMLHYDKLHEHHVSHCAGAYYTRPWESKEDTVMVSIDGAGEIQTAVIYDHNFNLIREWHYPKSVGLIYSTVTFFLGLRPLEDEYVVMGLSSYGEDKFSQWLYDEYQAFDDLATFELENELQLGVDSPRETARLAFRKRLHQKCQEHSKEDCAASVQEFARRAILEIMEVARQHGSKLCYSGGCAQNVVVNSLIHEMFDEVHVAIAPADSGSALGCAARTWAQETGGDRLIWTPYMGTNIDREINPTDVVDHLMKHQYCGVANGRAEYGPRALGNRSLIADVRFDVKDTVNEIKRRQKYRPFAPAILEEFADQYFEGPMNEYMQFTSKALHDYSSVTHVDGTARVQIVRKDCQSVFRKIIEEYYERTGVPMLLNTSLNIRGRPMVDDENDAKLWESTYNVKVF